MKNILGKILPRPRRLALASGFNKVAMVGNVAVTGYAINGKGTAVILTGLTLLYYGAAKLGMSHLMKKLKGQGLKGVEVSDGELVQKILELKDKAGLDGELHLMELPQPGKQMGTTQLPDGSIIVVASPELLNDFSDSEIASICAHEFGHIKHGDTTRREALEKSRRYITMQMYVFGALHSLLSSSPLPLLSSVAGTKMHKVLVGADRRIAEYRADDFAARLVGAGKAFNVLKRSATDNLKLLPLRVMRVHLARAKFLPDVLRRQITERKIPKILVETDIALRNVFDVSHPPTHKRLRALEGIAKKQGVTVDYSDVKGPQKTRACSGCMSLDSVERQANISNYTRQLFKNEFGHDALEIEFFECEESKLEAPNVQVIEISPGMVLEVSMQGGGEHLPYEIRELLESGVLPPEFEEMVRDITGGRFGPSDRPSSEDQHGHRPG